MGRVGVVACGALAVHVRAIARRRGWDVDVHPVPALLHNRPAAIPAAVEAELERLDGAYDVLAVAYADCGTYGSLEPVLDRFGVRRLAGDTATRCSAAPPPGMRWRRSPAPTC